MIYTWYDVSRYDIQYFCWIMNIRLITYLSKDSKSDDEQPKATSATMEPQKKLPNQKKKK